ncbi:efflux RND transporter periplasmic adaptor subunit [Limnoglobus roseus]|uniref:Efflux RND transporter periplasmic adaptor subunit n=1 Tax=Limnoglobus roseus TaxID=2598579 RepID=A0A5C1AMK2_9BACT|nr:efflux RND transporter periplasmic adaptor subunit [Limnoglobus roseus]QEL20210.1 efflux RND transporter periplasmic adaptor subunit [Limnoglobus roseus]
MRTYPSAHSQSRFRPWSRVGLVSLIALTFGCQGQKAAPQAPPPPAVSVLQPAMYSVQNYFEYNGYLDAVEMVQVKARVKGYLDKIHFKEGLEVEKGAALYSIDPREYEAGVAKAQADIARAVADIANAKAQIKLAETELKRQTDLGNASAQTDKDKAVATLAANQAQLQTALANEQAGEAALRTAKLELEYTQIKAPIGGLINRTLVTQGNLVGQSETTLLTTIVRMDELYVYFDAAERDLVEYLRSAQNASATADAVQAAMEVGVANDLGYPYSGMIDFRENRVDTGTGTVRIRGRLKNPLAGNGRSRLLYPGLYSKVRVPVGSPRVMPVIPEDALMTGQEGRYVFVIGENGIAQKRIVTVQPQVVWKVAPAGVAPTPPWMLNPPAEQKMLDGSVGKPLPPKSALAVVAIETGLAAGDRIVVNGLQKIVRPGMEVKPELWALQPPPPAK